MELSLDSVLSVILLRALVVADMGAIVLATSGDIQVHAENGDLRVVLEAVVDVRIDANAWEAKRKNELPKYTENKPTYFLSALVALTNPIKLK